MNEIKNMQGHVMQYDYELHAIRYYVVHVAVTCIYTCTIQLLQAKFHFQKECSNQIDINVGGEERGGGGGGVKDTGF